MILSFAGPSGGIISFITRAAKSTQACVSIGCTTLLAPWNCAPPGASSPSPVRFSPSSYCSSRRFLASLSFSMSSDKLEPIFDSSFSGMSTARFANQSLSPVGGLVSSLTIAPPSSVSTTSASSGISKLSPSCSSSSSMHRGSVYAAYGLTRAVLRGNCATGSSFRVTERLFLSAISRSACVQESTKSSCLMLPSP